MTKELSREFYDGLYQDEIYAASHYAHAAVPFLKKFVEEHNLQESTILDVGCGRGWFKDIVTHWVGLDISETAGKYVPNRFICGSAENIPLADESVDAIWSITFLEHSPQPEVSLSEMVRVLKRGGLIYLSAAWRVQPWRPKGYEVKSFRELALGEKILKLLLPVMNLIWAKGIFWVPVRTIRESLWKMIRKPTKLFFVPFQPNLVEFLLPDSDARNSIDQHEVLLWFLSRGFVLSKRVNMLSRILMRSGPIIVSKPTV